MFNIKNKILKKKAIANKKKHKDIHSLSWTK